MRLLHRTLEPAVKNYNSGEIFVIENESINGIRHNQEASAAN